MICSFCSGTYVSNILCWKIHGIEYQNDCITFICEGHILPVRRCTIYDCSLNITEDMYLCYKCEDKINESGKIDMRPTYKDILLNKKSSQTDSYSAKIEEHGEIPCVNCNLKYPRSAGNDITESCYMYSHPHILDGNLQAIYSGMWSKYDTTSYAETLILTGKNNEYINNIMKNYRADTIICDVCLDLMVLEGYINERWKLS